MTAPETTTRKRHLSFLILGLAVPLLGLMLQTVDHNRIAFGWLPDHPLPHVCLSRALFNFECPTCGLTRSTIHLMHGRLGESFAAHRLGWFVLLLFAVQVPYRTWRLTRDRQPPVSPHEPSARWLWGSFIALCLLNYAWQFLAF
jgi:cytochrome b561